MEDEKQQKQGKKLVLRMPPDVAAGLDLAAEEDDLSLNKEIIHILRRDLTKRGFIPKSRAGTLEDAPADFLALGRVLEHSPL